jgi:hypothetical protein
MIKEIRREIKIPGIKVKRQFPFSTQARQG